MCLLFCFFDVFLCFCLVVLGCFCAFSVRSFVWFVSLFCFVFLALVLNCSFRCLFDRLMFVCFLAFVVCLLFPFALNCSFRFCDFLCMYS